jgi:hypothetical protein
VARQGDCLRRQKRNYEGILNLKAEIYTCMYYFFVDSFKAYFISLRATNFKKLLDSSDHCQLFKAIIQGFEVLTGGYEKYYLMGYNTM